MKDLFNISGKTAVVTGGSSGIGLMIAKGFVEAGARVYIASRKAAVCEEVAQELSKSGECMAIPADLSSEAGAKALGDAIRERETGLDILVNNAGATWGAPFEEFPESGWDKILAINVKGPFFLTRELMPLLKNTATKEDPSRIINVGSIDGFRTGGPAFSYGASKAAIHQMTQNWAAQFAGDQITVNCIAPGPFPSKMMAFMTENEEMRKLLEDNVPLGRIGAPEDAAGLAIFLSSKAGSFMTGNILPLDGGVLIRPNASAG
ncbi:MAG: SDR family oxidoreductase [Deltaproteobacteria bacterium]|jgi:NAD(P)-dependent dehydrogenase (short-subunit alcohol dehydrogenase family)|nr:SDR family oxidoreductase [Deltaproteobacteria bacterium]MBT4263173.1 SDR family oxidoreductase [Deltaproteobacteria bacterium]MBT4641965.1 SDR family oxidoreductase [Deltaproteobacteria bacterium]MBT6502996.1 SDR family oxidoreductase [Deltaproteobacteria bacterium]MBT6612067.1 SDR family oxidoreductase [Deltaproteobacteria bacterium]